MARGVSVLFTALVAGAIGFGAGVYVGPTKEAEKFRAFVDEKISAMKKASKPAEKQKVEPAPAPENESLKEPESAAPPQDGGDTACDPAVDPNCSASKPEDAPAAAMAPAEPAPPPEQQSVAPPAGSGFEPAATAAPPAPVAAPSTVGTTAAPAPTNDNAAAPVVKKKPKPKPKPKPKRVQPANEPAPAQPD